MRPLKIKVHIRKLFQKISYLWGSDSFKKGGLLYFEIKVAFPYYDSVSFTEYSIQKEETKYLRRNNF